MTGPLTIVRSAGLATVQDLGWPTGRAMGLPPGGAMDPVALQVGNALVGNDPGDAGIEVTLGDLVVEFGGDGWFALTGAAGPSSLDGASVPAGKALSVSAGGRLLIGRPAGGRFGYLTVSGGVAVEPTLGSRSTYLPTGLGGLHGRRLTTGDRLPIGPTRLASPIPRLGPADGSAVEPAEMAPASRPIRITTGPQGHLFPPASFERLASDGYRVTPASDRMGTRLAGPPLTIRGRASLPSEATCLGAIQVPDDGQPIVVLRDGPTVGGYPKIGVVIGADLARFCQTPLGAEVRFAWVSIAEATQAARRSRAEMTRVLNDLPAIR